MQSTTPLNHSYYNYLKLKQSCGYNSTTTENYLIRDYELSRLKLPQMVDSEGFPQLRDWAKLPNFCLDDSIQKKRLALMFN